MKEAYLEAGESLELENEHLKANIAFLQRSLKISEILNHYKDRRMALLEQDAMTDKLTGVNNRRGFEEKLNQRSAELQENVVIVLADADGFKPINDELGHAAGDAVLREITDRLKNLVRSTDEVARIGGDEFVVVCFGGKEEELMEKFGNGLTVEMEHEGQPLSVRLSTGVAEKLPDETIEDAIRLADDRMYAFKRERGHAR